MEETHPDPWAIVLAGGDGRRLQAPAQLTALAAFAGTRREQWSIDQAYAELPAQNFSQSVLAVHPALAVSRLSGVLWSDLGTPRRVLKRPGLLRVRPAWATARPGA
jgi:hypothetical protein